jgi:hypothetical protein
METPKNNQDKKGSLDIEKLVYEITQRDSLDSELFAEVLVLTTVEKKFGADFVHQYGHLGRNKLIEEQGGDISDPVDKLSMGIEVGDQGDALLPEVHQFWEELKSIQDLKKLIEVAIKEGVTEQEVLEIKQEVENE